MAKRVPTPSSDSSLSPVAEDLIAQAESKGTIATSSNDKKRKAETTEVKLTKRTKKTTTLKTEDEDFVVGADASPRPNKRAPRKVKVEVETIGDDVVLEENGKGKAKVIRKTATRKKVEVEAAPFAERTTDSPLVLGAHVSTAGGVHNALVNVVVIGGNAFALFLRTNRKWTSPPLDSESINLFQDGCKKHGFEVDKCCLPHGSYLVNLAHPDPDRKKQAYDAFFDDLTRCHKLGIKLYNFHPGNSNANTREEGIQLIAEHINTAHQDPATGEVVAVLETMATLGNTIGGTFKDIAEIVDLVKNKDRVGVCLDTCHVFAAGYDLRTPEVYAETMQKFDQEIGLKYLKALHINDSKAPLSSNRDLHARIGTGYLGLRAFHNIVNDKRLHGLPMVLETPVDTIGEDGKKFEDKSIWAREIKLLEKLVGMDVESPEFLELEAKLQKEGEDQRKETGDAFDRKQAQAAKPKKAAKVKSAKTKTKTKTEEISEPDESQSLKPKKGVKAKAATEKKAPAPTTTRRGKKKVESEDVEEEDE